MIRRLFKDSVTYGIGQALYFGVPVLVIPVYSRLLAAREYGVVELITVAGVLVNFAAPLEINQGLARHYVDCPEESGKIEYASTALWFSVAVYALLAACGLAFSRRIAALLLDSPDWASTVSVGVIAIAATGLFITVQNQLRWQFTPRPYLAAALAYALASTGTSVALLAFTGLGAKAVLYGQLAGAVCGGSIAAWFARGSYRSVFRFARLRELLSFSAPLVPSSISVFLLSFVDRLIVKHLMGMAAVGVYSVGFRLASAVNLALLGLNASLTPLVFKEYRDPATPAALERIFRGFCAGTLPLLAAGSLFTPELLPIVAGSDYLDAWRVVPPLALASLFSRLYIFAPGLDIEKKTHVTMLINLVSASLNVGLCVLLIPRFGLAGAAASTLLAAAFGFAAYMVFSQRFYPVPHAWRQLLLALVVNLSAVAVGLSLSVPPAMAVVAKLGILATSSVLTFWLLGAANFLRGWRNYVATRATDQR